MPESEYRDQSAGKSGHPAEIVEPGFEKEETFIKDVGVNVAGEPTAVDVKNGRIVRIRPVHWDEKYTKEELASGMWKIDVRGKTFETSTRSEPGYLSWGYKKRIYSPNRVRYPLKRVDWDPDGERNSQNRGKSKFERISWDEATTIVANEIKRVQQTYGPYSVLCIGEDGHHEQKIVHACGGIHMRLLSKTGGYTREVRNPDSWEGWYWGAKHIWGNMPGIMQVGEPMPAVSVADAAQNLDMLVFMSDWETTSGGSHPRWISRLLYWFKELGIKQVYISPDLNYSAAVHADKWIPILPNTDAALQLAIIYTWITEGTYDKDYVATHVVGFDKLFDYVLGKEDGIPKTPEWASTKCGVPEWTIKALAEERASKTTSMGAMGGNFMRGPYGHETARLEAILLGMQGMGKPGIARLGGLTFGPPRYSVTSGVSNSVRAGVGDAVRALTGVPTPQQIPRTQTQHVILHPPVSSWGSASMWAPVEDQFKEYVCPIPKEQGGSDIHMIWSEKVSNTASWNNGFGMIEAYRNPRIECVVANHQWLENDCLFADIVLPVSCILEEEDMGNTVFIGQERVVISYQGQAIKPVGESKSDYEIACEIAKKLGVYEQFTEGKTIEEWIKYGYEQSGIQDQISWEKLKEKGYYIPPVAPDWQKDPSGLIEFYQDPVKHPLTTPSGKLEFYSQRLADKFPDDKERNPLPKWVEGGPGWTHDERLGGQRARRYPLLIITNHPRWRHHSQLDDVTWLREVPTCKVKGYDGYMYEPLWIHPNDAARRGIQSGDIVKVYNERGIVLGGAFITERMIPGAVSMDHGARVDLITDKIDRGGSINLITPEKGQSKNVWGQATSGFLVEVDKVSPGQMEEWRRKYPEAFARNYNPSYGQKFDAWIQGGMD
jgi:molybdopterin guanine dinucleotide-containing S/N-oxide reductase-like protein